MFPVRFIPRVVFRLVLMDAVLVVVAALRVECGSPTGVLGSMAYQPEMGLEHCAVYVRIGPGCSRCVLRAVGVVDGRNCQATDGIARRRMGFPGDGQKCEGVAASWSGMWGWWISCTDVVESLHLGVTWIPTIPGRVARASATCSKSAQTR